MDDMMNSMSGDAILGRRLTAYAETRLSPDLATSSRLRARVLAVAHRHADLARGDAGLTVLSRPGESAAALPFSPGAQARHRAWRRGHMRRSQRAAGALLAASLGVALLAGGAFAARPGGPLYDARLWAETLTLPSDPSARALAELARLEERLREATDASRAGDTERATAALAAYESIVTEASAAAILADDDVASAVITAGIGRNVVVLEALLDRVPAQASDAISRALDAAIAQSADAVERVGTSRGSKDGRGGGGGGQPGAAPSPKPTKDPAAKPTAKPAARPTAKPTPKPTPAQGDGGGGPKSTKSPKPGQGRGQSNQDH